MSTPTDSPQDQRTLDLLSDPIAQVALRLGLEEPFTASDVTTETDVTRSAVYPRLRSLEAVDLIESVPLVSHPSSSGTHYRTTTDRFTVEVAPDGIAVSPVDSRLFDALDTVSESFSLERAAYDRSDGTVTVSLSVSESDFGELAAYIERRRGRLSKSTDD